MNTISVAVPGENPTDANSFIGASSLKHFSFFNLTKIYILNNMFKDRDKFYFSISKTKCGYHEETSTAFKASSGQGPVTVWRHKHNGLIVFGNDAAAVFMQKTKAGTAIYSRSILSL